MKVAVSRSGTIADPAADACGLQLGLGGFGNQRALELDVDAEGLSALDPVAGSRRAEDAHEGACGLFVPCNDGTPLLQPRPQSLDPIAICVDPGRARRLLLVPSGRDHRTCPQVPDGLAKRVAAAATVGDHPPRRPGQLAQQRDGLGQFMLLA
jgi:hypothetical protein